MVERIAGGADGNARIDEMLAEHILWISLIRAHIICSTHMAMLVDMRVQGENRSL